MKQRLKLTDRINNKKQQNASVQDRSVNAGALKSAGKSSPTSLTSQSSQTTSVSSERNASRAVNLIVEPFRFLSFLEWNGIQEFNTHGVLKIKGLIAQEDRMKYMKIGFRETWVCAKAIGENDEEIILFQGVLTKLIIDSAHHHHTMNIEVKSGSYLLEKNYHTRVFQPDSMKYHDIIDTCLKEADAQFIMRERQGATTGQLTVQYQETDYKFILRLAHRLGIVVIPEVKTQGKRILLGLAQNTREVELISDNYTMSSSELDKDSLIRYEDGIFHVKTRDIHELGQGVIFQGRRLIIAKVESYLHKSELMHRYTLCTLKSSYERPQPHEQIKGISMQASVTAIHRALVQVEFHEDENKGQSGKRWFDFSTVYSSPDGTGWFAAPEEGDNLKITFPNACESGAYAASAVHLESDARSNPAHKSWKNKHNKEVLVTPTKIEVTNNSGLSVELDDLKGITVNSNRGIFIDSDGPLHLNSNAGVTVYGDRSVAIKQGAAQIRMKDGIDVAGGKINMN